VVADSIKNGKIYVTNKIIGKLSPARLVLVSSAGGVRDYAVLKIDSPERVRPLPISGEAKRAERVSAWGYPGLLVEADPKMDAL
jgi:hypothetical protein